MADSAKTGSTDGANCAVARPQVSVWSTDAIRDRERFSYWREALCQAVFNLTIVAQLSHFSSHNSFKTCCHSCN